MAVKLAVLRPHLDERQWRLLLGAEATAIGRGGISLVARVSGASRTTVQSAVNEIRAGAVPSGRVRAAGAGRPAVEDAQPGIEQALEGLVAPDTRGDPMSPLRWTTKSLAKLSKGLSVLGFAASTRTVSRLLRKAGYRLRAVFKTKEGAQHPDRDAQFGYINTRAARFLTAGDPVISIDTKKKELVGEYANKGREWQPSGQPVAVNGHDFPSGVPKAIPYGIYDVGADTGFVSVGVDHDTAQFAVNAIGTWWDLVGRGRYPHAQRLLITADCGGSNGYRLWAWKVALAALAEETGLAITVCHDPPGTSKWNRIEHRLFSFISTNWRGRPLTDYQVIIETIAATTTNTGPQVHAVLDPHPYPTGVKVSKADIDAVPITRHTLHPNGTTQSTPEPQTPPKQTKKFPAEPLGSVSVGDLFESAVADEDGGEVGKGLEMLGFAFVAAGQAAVVHQPGQCCLDDPTVPAQPLGGLDTLAGDPHDDAAAADLGPDCLLVVGLVAVQFPRPLAGPATSAGDRGDRVQQREQQLRVRGVSRRDQHRQRHTAPVAQDMDLRSWFAAVDRVWPRQIPLFSARTLIESTTARDQSIRHEQKIMPEVRASPTETLP